MNHTFLRNKPNGMSLNNYGFTVYIDHEMISHPTEGSRQ